MEDFTENNTLAYLASSSGIQLLNLARIYNLVAYLGLRLDYGFCTWLGH